jgi:hypothetical protein
MDDPPAENLIRAIRYFNKKYGSVPNRVELSPDWLEDLSAPQGLTITRSKSVQPSYLMLAIDPSLRTRLPGKTAPHQ